MIGICPFCVRLFYACFHACDGSSSLRLTLQSYRLTIRQWEVYIHMLKSVNGSVVSNRAEFILIFKGRGEWAVVSMLLLGT